VANARRSGVRRILTVGMDEGSNREAIAAAEEHEEVFAAVGRHPNSAIGFDRAAAADIEKLAEHERVRAIGETGLDYYRDTSPRETQHEAFRAQIAIARGTALPLVIHMRDQRGVSDALDDTFATLAADAEGVTVILHCCSVPPDRIGEAIEHGWYCSFAGNVTYPKSDDLRETARLVPDELLLVETDSPFLAPQPVRGKPNQPANVVEVAELLASERDVSYAELERTVEANAERIFKW
jgi:TatD DNase family protein